MIGIIEWEEGFFFRVLCVLLCCFLVNAKIKNVYVCVIYFGGNCMNCGLGSSVYVKLIFMQLIKRQAWGFVIFSDF